MLPSYENIDEGKEFVWPYELSLLEPSRKPLECMAKICLEKDTTEEINGGIGWLETRFKIIYICATD